MVFGQAQPFNLYPWWSLSLLKRSWQSPVSWSIRPKKEPFLQTSFLMLGDVGLRDYINLFLRYFEHVQLFQSIYGDITTVTPTQSEHYRTFLLAAKQRLPAPCVSTQSKTLGHKRILRSGSRRSGCCPRTLLRLTTMDPDDQIFPKE